jgi:hypothetical protein
MASLPVPLGVNPSGVAASGPLLFTLPLGPMLTMLDGVGEEICSGGATVKVGIGVVVGLTTFTLTTRCPRGAPSLARTCHVP